LKEKNSKIVLEKLIALAKEFGIEIIKE